ncbi:MAG: efflux RND transporter permease subunit, partial [Planctomycetes bacterium]|nr:efflux RND transporter permease subunit [Planctomycetota bacterium]
PVPVDAIPDIGENQQIVFTEWMGRSPQDIEDQITYPLTVSLLGIPGVKTIRSYSMFGFSTIYVVFKDDVEFYWSRSRLLEKLNSLSSGTLPEAVQPTLGPDATALGQVFWYTLEGRDEDVNPTGGWDLHELRTAQDWYVKYGLQAVDGVWKVASIGGLVKEYQIDVDPVAMRAYGVGLDEVFSAVRMSNIDVGARTIEINKVEYVVRGLDFVQDVEDLEKIVVMGIYLKQSIADAKPRTVEEVRAAVVEAGNRRVRPCLMTTATTSLALLPVLTSTGRGSDIMVPMAIPSFGGMTLEIMTMFVVPVLYCLIQEMAVKRSLRESKATT